MWWWSVANGVWCGMWWSLYDRGLGVAAGVWGLEEARVCWGLVCGNQCVCVEGEFV